MQQGMINEYLEYLSSRAFPCVAAKAAVTREQVKCMVAGNMACPRSDQDILHFLYEFVDSYRSADIPFHSAAILFPQPLDISEEQFEKLMWLRLQSLSDLDANNYAYDPRVNADPASGKFSFSLKSEAFFILGLHPSSSRASRQFKYPAIVFNPHAEFEMMRENGSYDKMKAIVRKRDVAYSGSVNPMLNDFGNTSEALQYSGKQYDTKWKCPLTINHGTIKDNTTP